MGCAGGAHYMGAPPGSLVAVCAEGLDGSLEASGMVGRLGPDFGKKSGEQKVACRISKCCNLPAFLGSGRPGLHLQRSGLEFRPGGPGTRF